MNLRWLVFDYAPREIELARHERRHVRRRAFWLAMEAAWKSIDQDWSDRPRRTGRLRDIMRHRLPLVLYGGFLFAVIVAIPIIATITHWRGIVPGLLVGAPLALAVWWALLAALCPFALRPHVATALREMGFNLCPACWYRLDGQTDDARRCPECGTERERVQEKPR
jgi:hypothetical protein